MIIDEKLEVILNRLKEKYSDNLQAFILSGSYATGNDKYNQ